MEINHLKRDWNTFGKTDPLWAIMTVDSKKGNRWQPEAFFRTGEEEIAKIMGYVDSMGINLCRSRALDFGCGVGRLTQALATYFSEVSGVDIAPSMIRHAKKFNRHRNCTYYLNDKTNLKLFGDTRFDFIYTSFTLQHIEPRYTKAYLAEFLRLLVTGGILVFNLPSERISPAGIRTGRTEDGKSRPQNPTSPAEHRDNRSVSGIKRLIKPLTPKPILDLYVGWRYPPPPPVMEMYTTKKEEVEGFLELNGGRTLDTVQIKLGPSWIGYQYCVTKST